MADDLQNILQEVKRTYFPRWDRSNKWTVTYDLANDAIISNDYGGLCSPGKRTIFLHPGDDVAFVLIHEICHAVTTNEHGKQWERRFLKVASKAESLGQNELAARIRNEVDGYRNTPNFRADMIYHAIEDALTDDHTAPLEDILKWLSRDFCLTRDYLLKTFPRIKKVYDRSKRTWEEYGRRQKELEEELKKRGLQ